MNVQTGLEVLRAEGFKSLAGKRVGLMTNPSATDRQLTSTYQIFAESPAVHLTALFGPEHGFLGAAPDAEAIATTIDSRTGCPVYSLYGETFRPTADMLHNIDVLVCDIQDIGVRYYTYTWTVSHILEATGEYGMPVIILDRPNPLGGVMIDGPQLDLSQSSFVGRFPVPVQHGLTLGELAQMINARWNPTPADLTVIPCANWQRDITWEQTGLPWIVPSPNMPHLSTLRQYPGACLIEGTELSEGRGTALPFEIVGAPWIDALALADSLNNKTWAQKSGVRFRPHTFQPFQSKWTGETCGGVQVYLSEQSRPLEIWLGVIKTIRALYPDQFAWLAEHPDTGHTHFDRLIGQTDVRQQINAGTPAETLLDQWTAQWDADRRAFEQARRPFLLYA